MIAARRREDSCRRASPLRALCSACLDQTSNGAATTGKAEMSTPSNVPTGGKKKLIVLFAVAAILSLGVGASAPLFRRRGGARDAGSREARPDAGKAPDGP
jgi:hypothetical protein